MSYYTEELRRHEEEERREREKKDPNYGKSYTQIGFETLHGGNAGLSDSVSAGGGTIFGSITSISIIIILALVGISSFLTRNLTKQMANEYTDRASAIAAAEAIEFGKEYNDNSVQNEKEHYVYQTYKFTVTEAGTVSVDYNCKKRLDKLCFVRWEVSKTGSDKVIFECNAKDFETESEHLDPGEYVIIFYSISNELNKDWFSRKYDFTVSFAPDEALTEAAA